MTHLLAAALRFAATGWHVFPLIPGGKTPAVKGWEQRATTDPDRVRRCWSAGRWNVGIACGPSGLVVVDLDRPKPGSVRPQRWQIEGVNDGADVLAVLCERHGQPFPALTHTVTTASGGTHLYFTHPAGEQLRNTSGEKGRGLGWLIDTRAHGGYVVAAGSIVGGNPYTVTAQLEPSPLPGWLAGLLRADPLPPRGPVAVNVGNDRRGRYVAAAIRNQLGHLAAAPQGQRNHALFTSAVALGQLAAGGALAGHEVAAVLEPVALSIGLRPGEIARTIASGLRAGARQPRHLEKAA